MTELDYLRIALAIFIVVSFTYAVVLFLNRRRTSDPTPRYSIGVDVGLYGSKTFYTVIDLTATPQTIVERGEVKYASTGEELIFWMTEMLKHYSGEVQFAVDVGSYGYALMDRIQSNGGMNVHPIHPTLSTKRHMVDVLSEAIGTGKLAIPTDYYLGAYASEDLSPELAYYGIYGEVENRDYKPMQWKV